MKRKEAQIKAYELYTQGYSFRQIQKILNKMGFTVHFTTIRYWINKPVQLKICSKEIVR
jgi:hypothetical protein